MSTERANDLRALYRRGRSGLRILGKQSSLDRARRGMRRSLSIRARKVESPPDSLVSGLYDMAVFLREKSLSGHEVKHAAQAVQRMERLI